MGKGNPEGESIMTEAEDLLARLNVEDARAFDNVKRFHRKSNG